MSASDREGMIAVPAGLFGPPGEAAASTAGADASAAAPASNGADASGDVPEAVEATVVVARRELRGGDAGAGEPGEPVDGFDPVEATVVVERMGEQPHAELDEATVVVERTGERPHTELDEATVVVERTGERRGEQADVPAELAATVERSASSPSIAHPAASVMHAPSRRSRRTPSRAPVSDEVLNTAEQGPGAGVLERYPSRPAEPLRIPVPELGEGPAPTRDPQQQLPSVARRTRRSALIGLGAVALAAVVGVAGVIAIGASVVGQLIG